MREFDPIKLASDGKKSRVYFRHLRWSGKRRCPRCGYRNLYICSITDLDANAVGTSLESLQEPI